MKAKELKQLSGEMDKIVYRNLNEKDSEIIFNDLEFRTTSPEGKNYTLRLNENRNATVDMTNHEGEGYRNLKKELDNRLTEVLQGEKVYADNNFKRPPTPITPPITRGYTGVSTYREIKYSHLSQKDQRRLEKLSKEKAELSRKQAEISRKQAEIVRAKAQNNPWMISVDAHATPKADYTVISKYVDSENTVNNKIVKTQNSRVITDGIENSNSGVNKFYINGKDAFEEDMKVTIDGKVVSREDLAAFDAKNIKDMNVVKSKVNGKAKGEIIINTKKENTK